MSDLDDLLLELSEEIFAESENSQPTASNPEVQPPSSQGDGKFVLSL